MIFHRLCCRERSPVMLITNFAFELRNVLNCENIFVYLFVCLFVCLLFRFFIFLGCLLYCCSCCMHLHWKAPRRSGKCVDKTRGRFLLFISPLLWMNVIHMQYICNCFFFVIYLFIYLFRNKVRRCTRAEMVYFQNTRTFIFFIPLPVSFPFII